MLSHAGVFKIFLTVRGFWKVFSNLGVFENCCVTQAYLKHVPILMRIWKCFTLRRIKKKILTPRRVWKVFSQAGIYKNSPHTQPHLKKIRYVKIEGNHSIVFLSWVYFFHFFTLNSCQRQSVIKVDSTLLPKLRMAGTSFFTRRQSSASHCLYRGAYFVWQNSTQKVKH